MADTPTPTTVTLPARGWALLVGGFVVLVVMMGAMLTLLETQRRHIASQDRKITALYEGARPLLRETRPALAQARRLAEPLRETGGELAALIRASAPVVDALNAADPPVLLTSVASAARAGATLAGLLLERGRMVALVDEAAALVREIERVGLVRSARENLAVLPAVLRAQLRVLVVQRRTLATQLRQYALQREQVALTRESLAVQRETLTHVRNLDRKTGGGTPVGG